MKPLTVTFGPTWPEHIALPAEGAQVGTVRLRATARLADGAGATIGEITGRLIVQAGQIVARGAGALPLKVLGSDRAPGSPRAPRYEVREVLTVDGRDIPQTFVVEPYESTTAPGTWDYRSPPVQGITYVNGLPLSLEQAQQYAADAQGIVTQGQSTLAALEAAQDALPGTISAAAEQAAAGTQTIINGRLAQVDLAVQQAAQATEDAQDAIASISTISTSLRGLANGGTTAGPNGGLLLTLTEAPASTLNATLSPAPNGGLLLDLGGI